MSTNCFKKTLKASATEILPKYGELVIVLGSRSELTTWNIYPAERMELTGSGHFTDSTGTQNLGKVLTNVTGSTYTIGCSEGDKLKVISKYEITNFSVQEGVYYIFKPEEILDVDYLSKVTYFNVGNGGASCIINIENFNNTVIEIFRAPYANNVDGAVEKFVEKAISLGRTSGYTNFSNYQGANCTFKGQTMAALYSSINLDWFRITYSANGATITNGDGAIGDLLATYTNGVWTYNF